MGPSSSEFPEIRYPSVDEDQDARGHRAEADASPVDRSAYAPRRVRVVEPGPEPKRRYIVLFLLTLFTTTWIGANAYEAFLGDFGRTAVRLSTSQLWANGFWYSASILAILGAHEFGHYFACRYYGINASLPYFLPAPPPILIGTFGAFIRIRSAFPSRRALF